MTFERLWVLLLLALPVAWAIFQWRASGLVKQGRLRLVLKALSVAAVIVALSEPRVESSESKLAVAALVDTSASVSAADLTLANSLVKKLKPARAASGAMAVAPHRARSSCRREWCGIPFRACHRPGVPGRAPRSVVQR